MKIAFGSSLWAFTLLLLLVNPLFAQSFSAEAGTPYGSLTGALSVQNISAGTVKYTSIDLSDPAIYAGEQFRIFINLENTGKKVEDHTIEIYRKGAAANVLMSSKQLTLSSGQNTEVTFTLAAENLLVKGQPAPESFIFIIGDEEIEVSYVK